MYLEEVRDSMNNLYKKCTCNINRKNSCSNIILNQLHYLLIHKDPIISEPRNKQLQEIINREYFLSDALELLIIRDNEELSKNNF